MEWKCRPRAIAGGICRALSAIGARGSAAPNARSFPALMCSIAATGAGKEGRVFIALSADRYSGAAWPLVARAQ